MNRNEPMQMKLGFIGYADLDTVEADSRFAAEHGYEGLYEAGSVKRKVRQIGSTFCSRLRDGAFRYSESGSR